MLLIRGLPRCAARRLSDCTLLAGAQIQVSRGIRTVALLPVPISLGQPIKGTDKSPSLLLDNGLLKLVNECSWALEILPEIKPIMDGRKKESRAVGDAPLNAKNCAEVGRVCERIFDTVYEQAQTDKFLLILGGDHCISLGTIPAIRKARPNTAICWIDAHADVNNLQSSTSGNMHGMPLAFLLGLVENASKLPGMQWLPTGQPCLQPQDLVYIGLRDLDPFEKAAIKRLKIKAFTMHDVDKMGIGAVMDQTADYFKNYDNIHLSFDIDALDPFFAPSTGTAVRGGLTFREGNYCCEVLAMTGKLSSMELVEVNPSLHSALDSKKTIDMAMTLLGSTLGQQIL